MKIGSLILDNITVFAPMAGITNLPIRMLAKEQGCGLVCSEMLSSRGLVQKGRRTLEMLKSDPKEKPLSVQIFGADPDIMADAAAIVEASGADIIDINFGCSVRKILKSGSGSALMKDPDLTARIIRAVRNAVTIPLTIKIRSGWDSSGDQAVATARIAEDNGVNAVAVHPRTAKQGFSGTADWTLIAKIKSLLTIPVIGNGDITLPEHALDMLEQTGCDAVMVGRAAMGNPWIFSQIKALLAGSDVPKIDRDMQFDLMGKFVDASYAFLGEKQASFMMRSRLGWFVKGLRHSNRFRVSLNHLSSRKEAHELIRRYRKSLEEKGGQQTPETRKIQETQKTPLIDHDY
jgi:tRNA-dihydrouridine synthase B